MLLGLMGMTVTATLVDILSRFSCFLEQNVKGFQRKGVLGKFPLLNDVVAFHMRGFGVPVVVESLCKLLIKT
jgi:hypothetical protein